MQSKHRTYHTELLPDVCLVSSSCLSRQRLPILQRKQGSIFLFIPDPVSELDLAASTESFKTTLKVACFLKFI